MLGVATQSRRGDPDVSHLADPVQPLIESAIAKLRRGMNATGDVAERHGKIAGEDFRGMPAELQQSGSIADQGRLSRLQRRLCRNRRSEPTGRGPYQNGRCRQGIDGDEDDRELEQSAPYAVIAPKAVDHLVDDDSAVFGHQGPDDAYGNDGIVALRQAAVGDEIRIG